MTTSLKQLPSYAPYLATFTGELLVTGGTGFLGGAIVASLLATPLWSRVRLLVRAASQQEGAIRVVDNLLRFELPQAQLDAVRPEQILLGDFRDAEAIFAHADLSRITHVINSAAIATFSNHPGLWPINVDGTFRFVQRLHQVAKLQRFVHIGTAMSIGADAPSPVVEGYVPGPTPLHLVPYTRTKIAIEDKIRAELPTLPFVAARPSIVVGHSRLGTRPSGSIFWVFRIAQLLGRFTCALDDHIDVVPVDWTADALIHLTLKPTLAHSLYHLSAGPDYASNFSALDVALARGRSKALGRPVAPLGAAYSQASYEELAAMREHYEEKLGPCNPRIMQRAIKLYGVFAALDITFHNKRMLAEGVPPPPRFGDYADLCAQTSESTPIAEQMVADFK